MNDRVPPWVSAVCPTCTNWHGHVVGGSPDDTKSVFLILAIVVILTFGREHDPSVHHIDSPAFAIPWNESANLGRIERVIIDRHFIGVLHNQGHPHSE